MSDLRIRIARPDDAAGIREIYAPYCESSSVSFEVVAPSVEQIRERICRILPDYPWLVSEIGGQVAGYVYASQHRERAAYRWVVEVAVYVSPLHQRRGLGRALYSALVAILRRQGFFKALAGITLPNPGSVGLHEAMGFRPLAVYRGVGFKDGRWLDVGWWQLDLQPENDNPPQPRLFAECSADREVQQTLTAAGNLLL
jgi:phosphinothricin acetyltransferase